MKQKTLFVAAAAAEPQTVEDIQRQLESLKGQGEELDSLTAEAVLAMIKAGGVATVMPNSLLLRHSVVITCHPAVYDIVRTTVDAQRREGVRHGD